MTNIKSNVKINDEVETIIDDDNIEYLDFNVIDWHEFDEVPLNDE